MAASSIGAHWGSSPVRCRFCGRAPLVAMLGNVTFDGRHLEFLDLRQSPFHRR
ncbi:hypothetical protein ACNKHL_24670 [Shigella flexneri]